MKDKIRKKVTSMQFRLFLVIAVTALTTTILIILINNLIGRYVYIYSKTKRAIATIEKMNEYYNEEKIPSDAMRKIKEDEEIENFEIAILDKDNIIYNSKTMDISLILLFKQNPTGIVIYRNDKVVVTEGTDGFNYKKNIVSSKLDNGYEVYIAFSYAPIEGNTKIINNTLFAIGIFLAFIMSIIAYAISYKISNPIKELNRITKKMSELDFSEKYNCYNANVEINNIGMNINKMSDKLEETITKLRKHNNELESDIEEKAQIDKMRKQFISDVSHELKTPIGLIQGYSEGLIENVNSDEESRKFYAEVIRDEAIKMDSMVKKLLELMKLEYKERKFKDEEFDLREVIKEELKRNTVLIDESKITVEFDDDKPIKVFADQECIEQIVNNYLSNAIKHAEEKDKEKKIIIRTEKTKEQKVRLFVYNSGEKIPKEYINKIWGRFFKVDDSRNREAGGTGIGLALVKAIMSNYGNSYGVKNYDNGVEFYCDINTKKPEQKDKN